MPFHQYEQQEDGGHWNSSQGKLKKILDKTRNDIAESGVENKELVERGVNALYYWRNKNFEMNTEIGEYKNHLESLTVARQLAEMRVHAGLPVDANLSAFIEDYEKDEEHIKSVIDSKKSSIESNEKSMEVGAKDPRIMLKIEEDAHLEDSKRV